MFKIYFSAEKANQLLPKVAKKLLELQEIHKQVEELRGIQFRRHTYELEDELVVMDLNQRYHALSVKFFKKLAELTQLGAIVKDVNQGLIDFYAVKNGKEVFLCWKLGEEKITHWHSIETGFNNRQSLDSNTPPREEKQIQQQLEKLR